MLQLARLLNKRRGTMRVSVCALSRGARVRLLSELSVRNAAGRVVSVEKPPMVVVARVSRGTIFFLHRPTAFRAQSIVEACISHAPRRIHVYVNASLVHVSIIIDNVNLQCCFLILVYYCNFVQTKVSVRRTLFSSVSARIDSTRMSRGNIDHVPANTSM